MPSTEATIKKYDLINDSEIQALRYYESTGLTEEQAAERVKSERVGSARRFAGEVRPERNIPGGEQPGTPTGALTEPALNPLAEVSTRDLVEEIIRRGEAEVQPVFDEVQAEQEEAEANAEAAAAEKAEAEAEVEDDPEVGEAKAGVPATGADAKADTGAEAAAKADADAEADAVPDSPSPKGKK